MPSRKAPQTPSDPLDIDFTKDIQRIARKHPDVDLHVIQAEFTKIVEETRRELADGKIQITDFFATIIPRQVLKNLEEQKKTTA